MLSLCIYGEGTGVVGAVIRRMNDGETCCRLALVVCRLDPVAVVILLQIQEARAAQAATPKERRSRPKLFEERKPSFFKELHFMEDKRTL